MKRTLVKHGQSSLIIALPHQWIKDHHLAQGDELEVLPSNSQILITVPRTEVIEKVILDASQISGIIKEVISSAYKRGIDEIEIINLIPRTRTEVLTSVDKRELGYEIFETGKTRCVIKRTSRISDEFDSILRRIFIITLTMADEGFQHLNNRDRSSLETISILERSNDTLTVMCRRYLNKYRHHSYDRIGPLYYIIETLEKIADEYRYLYEDFCKSNVKKLHRKSLLHCLEQVNMLLRLFYEGFYEKSFKKMQQIKENHHQLFTLLRKEASVVHGSADAFLHAHINILNERIFSMLEPGIILLLQSDEVTEKNLEQSNSQ